MSNKGKFPKKMVQTRAQVKSKEFSDSHTVKPVTHNHTNYETDEPLATSQANRKPDREYPFDLITGDPRVELKMPPSLWLLGRNNYASSSRSVQLDQLTR